MKIPTVTISGTADCRPTEHHSVMTSRHGVHLLVRIPETWILTDEEGHRSEKPHLLELLEGLPPHDPGTGRKYIVTTEHQALRHAYLIEKALGWTVTEPFTFELCTELARARESATTVLAASDASLLPGGNGAIGFAVFDGETVTVGGYSLSRRKKKSRPRREDISRLESLAALETTRRVTSSTPHASLVLGTDSRSVHRILTSLAGLERHDVGTLLNQKVPCGDLTPTEPARILDAAHELRAQLRTRQAQVTWVPSHTVREAPAFPRSTTPAARLARVRAQPQEVLLQELNVIADQTARSFNGTRHLGESQNSTCRNQLRSLAAARFPGARIHFRF